MKKYVYIMERTTNRSLWARITFQKEIKIGIAKKPQKRRQQVDSAIKGKIRLILQKEFDNARVMESKLHEKFKDSRFKIKGGPGGGCTEWFYLSASEYQKLVRLIRGWWLPSPYLIGILIIWAFYIYLIFIKYL